MLNLWGAVVVVCDLRAQPNLAKAWAEAGLSNFHDFTDLLGHPKIMLTPTKILPPQFPPKPLYTLPSAQILLQIMLRVVHSTLPHGNSFC